MAGPRRWHGMKLVAGIETGNDSAEVLCKSVDRVAELLKKMGRFDDPVERFERSVEDQDRLEFNTAIAASNIVLLKNDNNIFKLSTKASVAVNGHFSTNPSIGGGGSAKVQAQLIISSLCGLETGFKCRNKHSQDI
jgi:beta-glucosidase